MPEHKVKISNIVENQIPEFLNEENPLFKEFLNLTIVDKLSITLYISSLNEMKLYE